MSTTRRWNPDGTVNVCSWCHNPTGGHDYDCPRWKLYTPDTPKPAEFCADEEEYERCDHGNMPDGCSPCYELAYQNRMVRDET